MPCYAMHGYSFGRYCTISRPSWSYFGNSFFHASLAPYLCSRRASSARCSWGGEGEDGKK